MPLYVKKLNALPGTLDANTMYLIKASASSFKIYVTDSAGTVAAANTPGSIDITRYDLPTSTTTGAMNLATNQVFKVDLTTSGVRTVSFSNPPANTRSMVIVVETIGNTGSIVFPGSVIVATDVDTTPGATRSIFTIFFDGTNYTLVNNSKVA